MFEYFMGVNAPAQIITAPAQFITAPVRSPVSGVAVYTALLLLRMSFFLLDGPFPPRLPISPPSFLIITFFHRFLPPPMIISFFYSAPYFLFTPPRSFAYSSSPPIIVFFSSRHFLSFLYQDSFSRSSAFFCASHCLSLPPLSSSSRFQRCIIASRPLFYGPFDGILSRTVGQNNQKSRLKYRATRLSVCSHRSLVRLLRTARIARALRCAHSFARSLTSLTPSLVGK